MSTKAGALVARACRRTAWAMPEDWIRLLIAVAERNVDAADLGPEVREAVANFDAGESGDREGYRVANGVAVVPVVGPLVRYGDLFSEVSGLTSHTRLRQQLLEADADSAVSGVVLEIDSPGGEVNGIVETAQIIREMRTPTVAYVANHALSGAYWLAAAADEVVGHATSIVGSIGAVITVGAGEADDDLVFVSSRSPNKRVDPASEAGAEQLQRWVDDLGDVFIRAVADGRGMTEVEVVENFGRGGIIIGAQALERGGLDRFGVMADITESIMATEKLTAPVVTAAWVAETHPEVHAAILAAGAGGVDVTAAVAAAVDAERVRILGVHAQRMPGYDELVDAGMADVDATSASVALEILAAERGARAKALAAVKTDIDVPVVDAPTSTKKPAATTAEGWREEWQASADLQGEFADVDGYVAYQRAFASGKVRVLGQR